MKTLQITCVVLFLFCLLSAITLYLQHTEINKLKQINAEYETSLKSFKGGPEYIHSKSNTTPNKSEYKRQNLVTASPDFLPPSDAEIGVRSAPDSERSLDTESTTIIPSAMDESYFDSVEGEFNRSLERLSNKGLLTDLELLSELDQDFHIAKYDYETAEDNNNAFYDIFSSHPELADLPVIDTNCKTYQCRLTIAIPNQKSTNHLMSRLPTALRSYDSRFEKVGLINIFDSNKSELTLYVMGMTNLNTQ